MTKDPNEADFPLAHDATMPAFPFVVPEVGDAVVPGLTMLDYFATRAPKEIPAFFMPEADPFDGPPYPQIPAEASEDDKKLLAEWTRDGCFDLPDEYAWFAEAAQDHRDAMKVHAEWYAFDRYYEWPWAWANSMLMTRELYMPDDDDGPQHPPSASKRGNVTPIKRRKP